MKLSKNQFKLLLVLCLIAIVVVAVLTYLKIISFIFMPIVYAFVYFLIKYVKKK